MPPRWTRLLGVLAIGGVLLAAGTLVVTRSATPLPRSSPYTIDLTIARDPATGLYGFSSTNLAVPTGALVRVTIVNFDPANHSVVPVDCNVTGTVGGMMVEMGSGMGQMRQHSVDVLGPGSISHTFTMRSGGYELNVPIPRATSVQVPSVTEFTFRAFGFSTATWDCEAFTFGPEGAMMGSFESS